MSGFSGVTDLAGLQHGLVSRRQLAERGASWNQVERWRRAGLLASGTGRVLVVAGSASTALQRVMLAVMDAGDVAVASHWMAAWLWRLTGFDLDRLDVTVLRGNDTRAPRMATLHRPRLLLPHHVTHVENVPVTSIARTVFDMAGVLSPRRTERLVDTVVTRSPSMLEVLHRTLDELAARGRAGITTMRTLLAERPVGTPVVASGLEARFEEILRMAGEAPLSRQVDAGGHDWIGRVDFCDRELALLVEVDSALHHTSLLDMRLDAIRDEALTAAGWRKIVRIPEHWIWHEPWRVVAAIRSARAELRQSAA